MFGRVLLTVATSLVLAVCSFGQQTPQPSTDYLRQIPKLRWEAYLKAKPEWDSGVAFRVRDGTAQYREQLLGILDSLASKYYPPNHFGKEGIMGLCDRLLSAESEIHSLIYDVQGDERKYGGLGRAGGEMNRDIVNGHLFNVLEGLIVEVVGEVGLARDDKFNFKAWKLEWEKTDRAIQGK